MVVISRPCVRCGEMIPVERLEAMPGLIWIDEVHLQPQEKGEGSITCTLKLIIFANRTEISG